MTKLTEGMVIGRTRATDLASVRKLNCWGSELSDVSLVRHMTNVEVLSLSVNGITTLADFAHCPNLQELYVRKNKVTELSDILYLKDLPKLRHFWLEDNPCAVGDRYRLTVLKHLPNLKKLDNIVVNAEEVNDAEHYGLDLEHPADKKSQQFAQSPSEKVSLPPINSTTSPSPPHTHNDHSPPSLPPLNTADRDNDLDAEGNVYFRSNLSAGSPDSLTHPADTQERRTYSHEVETPKIAPLLVEDRTKLRMTRSRSDNFTSLSNSNDIELSKEMNNDCFESSHTTPVSSHHLDHRNSQPQQQVQMSNQYSRANLEFQEHFHHQQHPIPPPPQYSHHPNSIHSDVYASDPGDDHDHHHHHPVYRDEQVTFRYPHPHAPPPLHPMQHHSLLKHHHGQFREKILDSPNRPYPTRPKNRNSNILSAVLCLIKELDSASLEVVDMAVHGRLEELDD